MREQLSQLILAAGFFLLSACSGEPSADKVTEKAQAVLGGITSERGSVVYVRSTGGERASGCSGTLIAPNLVVTARHCVSAFTDGIYSCTIDGKLDLSRQRSPANAGDMGLAYPAEMIAIHTGLRPDSSSPDSTARMILTPETDTICRNDLAFLVLENDIDVLTSPLRLDAGVELGEPITVVGYGTNDKRLIERTERSGLSILGVGPSEFYPAEGSALPRTFVIGPSVCQGDSGGPAFSETGNDLIGVFSFIRGDCESSEARNFFTEVGPFHELARTAFEQAGHSELLEPLILGAAGGGGEPAPQHTSRSSSGSNGGCVFGSVGNSYPSLPVEYLLGFTVLLVRRRRTTANRKKSATL